MTATTVVQSVVSGSIRALIRCDGAAVPSEVAGRGWDVDAALTTGGEEADLRLHVAGATPWDRSERERRAADLVRIAACAYGADQEVSRGGLDVHRARWRRRMTLAVPVSDPAFWSTSDVVGALTAALDFGTEDAWGFIFTERPVVFHRGEPMDFGPPRARGEEAVVLFSGGIDSTCALVEALAAGVKPTVVSHRSTPPADTVQKAVLARIRDRFRDTRIHTAPFWIHRKGADPADTSQRTRGFLFAALGLAVAGRSGIGRVLLPDNGYVSINPAINGQLVGALASRGTHPTFLRLVNRLAALVFPDGPVLENPLAGRTRAQALEILTDNGVSELVGLTRSCGKHRGRPKEQPHCGGCSQCVDRRFAVSRAGLEAHDPAERYGVDVFRGPLKAGEGVTIPVSYVRFARETDGKDANALFAERPELIGCLDGDRADVEEQAEGLAGVLATHAAEVIAVMGTMLGRHGQEILRGSLGRPNLLQMFAGGGSTEADPAYPLSASPEAGPPDGGVEAATPARNALRRRGRQWHVVFRGEKAVVPHSVGLERVATIVKAGRASLLALDVVSGTTPGRSAVGVRSDGVREEVGTLEADQPGRRQRRPRVPPGTDLEARARTVAELLGSLEPDSPEYAQLEAEADTLAERWTSEHAGEAVGREKNPFEGARSAVAHSVTAAYAAIDREVPSLVAHLKENLHVGVRCWYHPRPAEAWDVDLGAPPTKTA